MKYLSFTKFIALYVLCGLMITQNSQSQTKGSFDVNITFQGQSRALSFYVPNDYDSTKKYGLIVGLHGSGDHSSNFRNYLIYPVSSGGLSWPTFITNTIIACPDGGNDGSRDFYTPAGDQYIIDSTIQYVKNRYNIDDKNIILEGFSLGGRCALKYGLENYTKFKGLLLNTPAVQGILDADNNLNSGSLIYNYKNGINIPVAITHGVNDVGYGPPVDTVFTRFVENKVKVIYFNVPGMAHAIPGQAIIQKCLNFINQPLKNNTDVELINIKTPDRTYISKIKPSIRLRNFGTSDITTVDLSYTINGTSANYTWNGTLTSFDYKDIQLPEINCQETDNTYSVQITKINEGNADPLLSKKLDSTGFQFMAQSYKLPLFMGFELTEPTISLWGVRSSGNMMGTWSLDTFRTQGKYSLYMYNIPLFFYSVGLSEDILSPILDLSSVNHPCLSFDVGFDDVILNPPYGQNNLYTDTLKVLITSDSGRTYTTIYTKYGSELATVTTPFLFSDFYVNNEIFAPTASQIWRTEIIRLDTFQNINKAVIVFKYVSGWGGFLYLDNLKLQSYEDLSVTDEITGLSATFVSPNPASDFVNIIIPENMEYLKITNMNGEQIYTQNLNPDITSLHLNTADFPSGIYIIELTGNTKALRNKLIILK